MVDIQEKDIGKQIEKAIYKYPLALLSDKYSKFRKVIDNYLPYSHGIEFECIQQKSYQKERFLSIPNIMEVNVDINEQRYRIPSGLDGMVCLWNICELMRKHSIVDLNSSNHYHTDMTDVMEFTHTNTNSRSNTTNDFQKQNNDWIIESLKKWETAFDYTLCRNWYYYNDIGTLEVRIGEPTFDYNKIITRLIQCSKIVTRLKREVLLANPRLLKLENMLKDLAEDIKTIKEDEDEINKIINSRTIKL